MNMLARNKTQIWPQLLLFLVLTVALLRKIYDPDIWFHMVIGRETLRQWVIPQAEFYIFPLLGDAAAFHEVGFGVFYQLVYNLGGFSGMAIANALLASAALLCLYRAVSDSTSKFNAPALLVLGLTAFYLDFRLVYRPESVLFLCLAIEILCLERFAATAQPRWLWPIPLAAWLLSQMHPSSLIMLGVLGMYGCQFVWQNQPLGMARRRLVIIFSVLAVTTLALASINPFGFVQVYLPLQTLFGSMQLQNSIAEYLPVLQTEYKYHYIALVISGGMSLLMLPQRRLVHAMLYLVFGWLAYHYVRNLGLFALVMCVPVTRMAQHLSQLYLKNNHPKLAFLALPVMLAIMLVQPVTEKRWGVGLGTTAYPERSIQAIQTFLPGGNVLNFYNFGGYLAWALGDHYKIAVDGHNLEHNNATRLHSALLRADPGWQSGLDYYQVNAIVIPATQPVSGRPIPLLKYLAQDNAWTLVGVERVAMLFVRSNALPGYAPRLDKNLIWEKMITEAHQTAARYPRHPGSYRALTLAYRALGDEKNAGINERRYQQQMADNPMGL